MGHFLRFHPWGDPSAAPLLAYFEGYQAALEAAPPEELTCAARLRWREDLRDCVDRCTVDTLADDGVMVSTIGVRVDAPRQRVLAAYQDPGVGTRSTELTKLKQSGLGIFDLSTGRCCTVST